MPTSSQIYAFVEKNKNNIIIFEHSYYPIIFIMLMLQNLKLLFYSKPLWLS